MSASFTTSFESNADGSTTSAVTAKEWASKATRDFLNYLKKLDEPGVQEFSRNFLSQDEFNAISRVVRARGNNPELLKIDAGERSIPDSQLAWEKRELEDMIQALEARVQALEDKVTRLIWNERFTGRLLKASESQRINETEEPRRAARETEALLFEQNQRADDLQTRFEEQFQIAEEHMKALGVAHAEVYQLQLKNRHLQGEILSPNREDLMGDSLLILFLFIEQLKRTEGKSRDEPTPEYEEQPLSAAKTFFLLFESTTTSSSSKPPITDIWTFLPSWLADDFANPSVGTTAALRLAFSSEATANVKALAMNLYSLTIGDVRLLGSYHALSLLSRLSKLAGEATETEPKLMAFVLNQVVLRLRTAPDEAWKDDYCYLPATCIAAGLLAHSLTSRWPSDGGPWLVHAHISLEEVLTTRCRPLCNHTLTSLVGGASAVSYHAALQGLLYAKEKVAFVGDGLKANFFIIHLEDKSIRLVSKKCVQLPLIHRPRGLAFVGPPSPDAGLVMPILSDEHTFWWFEHFPPGEYAPMQDAAASPDDSPPDDIYGHDDDVAAPTPAPVPLETTRAATELPLSAFWSGRTAPPSVCSFSSMEEEMEDGGA